MSRSELLRRLVLREISDDYEHIDQIIFPHVSRDGARFGLSIDRPEIVNTLAGLIADGLAKAYNLTFKGPDAMALDGMPPVDVVEEDFSIITQKGLDFYLSDDTWWPFGYDDEPDVDTPETA